MPFLNSYATIGIKKTCFISCVRERQVDKNINWMTVVSRNEKISHALRWIGISCSDSKKERKDFYRRIFFWGYPHARQGAIPGEFLLFSYPYVELWRSSLIFRSFVYRYTKTHNPRQPIASYLSKKQSFRNIQKLFMVI